MAWPLAELFAQGSVVAFSRIRYNIMITTWRAETSSMYCPARQFICPRIWLPCTSTEYVMCFVCLTGERHFYNLDLTNLRGLKTCSKLLMLTSHQDLDYLMPLCIYPGFWLYHAMTFNRLGPIMSWFGPVALDNMHWSVAPCHDHQLPWPLVPWLRFDLVRGSMPWPYMPWFGSLLSWLYALAFGFDCLWPAASIGTILLDLELDPMIWLSLTWSVK